MGESFVIDVLGTPAPKGSSRAFVNKKTGRAFVAPGGTKINEEKILGWNGAVRDAAAARIGHVDAPPFVKVPIAISISFRMARGAGHFGTGKHAGKLKPGAPKYPATKPDIDKLARTTLDALTGVVFDDDSRIAKLVLEKVFAEPGREGATIVVGSMPGFAGEFVGVCKVGNRVVVSGPIASLELEDFGIAR